QAQTDKIVKVQSDRKQNKYYKYLAVAASIALVAFVSIYESREFDQVKGLFDDTKVQTAPKVSAPESQMELIKDENISVESNQIDETVKVSKAPAINTSKIEKTEIEAVPEGFIEKKIKKQTAPEEKPKKRTEKSQTVLEETKVTKSSKGSEIKPKAGMPAPPEPVLDLGEPVNISDYAEFQSAPKPSSISLQSAKVDAISIEVPKADVKKEKVELSLEEMQSRALENLRKRGVEDSDMRMLFQSDEGKDNMPEPQRSKDSSITEINIYKIKLDSLEKKYEGIYSPHYRESSAKRRAPVEVASLDSVILEISETCFKVGILSIDDREREAMIEKLQRLSIHGSPETIEKIQRFIVTLMSAE
ncbi:MAG: hypothetical protein GY865_16655, partial [candidate division Zixibacteria bacterium]|nr:hypothetical protein [candidate division Zixibacteria bacterium]